MVKKTPRRGKHIPQRTCVGCRMVLPKRSLTRVVRTPDGVRIDPTGKLAGRGAYVHDARACWDKALKGALANALKIEFTAEDLTLLMDFAENITDEVQPAGQDAGAQ